MAQLVTCAPTVEPVSTHSQDHTDSTSTDFTIQDIAFLSSNTKAPFDSIRSLFDHLRAHPGLAEKPNATYPARRLQDRRDNQPSRGSKASPRPLPIAHRAHPYSSPSSPRTLRPRSHPCLLRSSDSHASRAAPARRNLNFRLCDY